MKNAGKKLICIIICTIIVLTSALVPVSANENIVPEHKVVYDLDDPGYNEGEPHLTTAEIFSGIDRLNNICEKFFGFKPFNGEKLKVKADGIMEDMFRNWTESSNRSLDFDLILQSIPNIGYGAEEITTLFQLSPEVFNDALRQKSAELSASGKQFSAFIVTFMRVYLLVIDDVTITAYPNEQTPDIYNVKIVIKYKDGKEETFDTGMVYNGITKVFGTKSKGGIFGFNVDTNDYTIFAVTDPWQRYFGFCLFYDFLANATKLYDYKEKRITFTYDNKEWLFEIWKGKYHQVGIGAELGMYNRPAGITKTSFYNCAQDEDMMVMSLELYQGNRLIFSRKPQLHWWLVGFCIEDRIYDADYLTVKGTIDFPDEEMAEIFAATARDLGITVTVNNTHVEWEW